MPTYTLGIVVCEFEYNEVISNDIRQRIYSRPNKKNEQEWALVSGMMIEQYLSEYFGVKYMLPKLDHLALPESDYAGTENWGLVTYKEKLLLCNKKAADINSKIIIAKTIANLLTHQWFGGYVTIKWWSYLWLTGGFATLFSFKALNNVNKI